MAQKETARERERERGVRVGKEDGGVVLMGGRRVGGGRQRRRRGELKERRWESGDKTRGDTQREGGEGRRGGEGWMD